MRPTPTPTPSPHLTPKPQPHPAPQPPEPGFQKLVTSSPLLAARPELRAAMNLRTIDVIAARLWFDRKVDCRYPANVLAGFER